MLTTAVNRNLSDPALDAQLAGSAFVLGGDGHLFLTNRSRGWYPAVLEAGVIKHPCLRWHATSARARQAAERPSRLRRHGQFLGSRVAGSEASIARLQRSSARYYQRPDATHLIVENPSATTRSGWSLQSDFNTNNGNIRPNASFLDR